MTSRATVQDPLERAKATTRLLVKLIQASGLPTPTLEFYFAKPRKWRFDLAWPDRMLALEIDGGIWTQGRHSRGAGQLRDMEKMNEATMRGWRVYHCTPDQAASGAVLGWIGVDFQTLRPGGPTIDQIYNQVARAQSRPSWTYPRGDKP